MCCNGITKSIYKFGCELCNIIIKLKIYFRKYLTHNYISLKITFFKFGGLMGTM